MPTEEGADDRFLPLVLQVAQTMERALMTVPSGEFENLFERLECRFDDDGIRTLPERSEVIPPHMATIVERPS